ncbi:phosphoribosylanthranilate isomerase [Jeotgalibacillus sp. R-1-5s-1]|uniref:phosphoribosylanthranilate isomerase n=1 Tax=Jeotgalibacillus sp. R-1-5s-1 TaxID=2555897 RepID=UPI00106D95FB|nr:phosphoribosylanthranilate isomerase [Jeotgalibacillus sp. R-1-5s-1]TFD99986.1 phosphoribosylanthranilate isomerase [Jeotgalibacillus sp. R-1-5s-1]
MVNQKFNEFIHIAKKLNDIGIIPLLMGSVGLEVVTDKSWDAQDLDIHVPGDKRGWEVSPELNIHNWNEIVRIMISMDYRLIDLHEHEFAKDGLFVEFGIIDTLPAFAGVQLEDLDIHQTGGAKYYLLNPEQYLSVYKSSSEDSYRAENNNNKDFEKIYFLTNMIPSNQKSD